MQITEFSNNYRFLSNFYLHDIVAYDRVWPSNEHLYQAMKTLSFDEQEIIRSATSPGRAKKLGRVGFRGGIVTIRPDWEQIKLEVMLQTNILKYKDTHLSTLLKKTEPAILIEGNYWHDNYWGNCYCPNCQNIIGENNLGKILMFIRSNN